MDKFDEIPFGESTINNPIADPVAATTPVRSNAENQAIDADETSQPNKFDDGNGQQQQPQVHAYDDQLRCGTSSVQIPTAELQFQIFIKVTNGRTIRLFVNKTDKIRKVFRMIEATFDDNETADDLRLSFGEPPLEEDHTLEFYKIKPESTLFLNGRICGGGMDIWISKYVRLSNLFTHVIRGHPNHLILAAQLNELTSCNTNAALDRYDLKYPLHIL